LELDERGAADPGRGNLGLSAPGHDRQPHEFLPKLRRAERRYDFGWLGRLERKVTDMIGGRPSVEPAGVD
jgi:hypothetical protein